MRTILFRESYQKSWKIRKKCGIIYACEKYIFIMRV